MKPKTLSIFEEVDYLTNITSSEDCENCECYGAPCDCDRSCDVSDPCQSCVSCEN